MEAGILIWIVVGAGLLLALAAVTLSYLTYRGSRSRWKVEDERWHNFDGRLTGLETSTATIVKSLPTGPELVRTFTAPGAPVSDVEPIYPTPPDGPRSTALPLPPAAARRRG